MYSFGLSHDALNSNPTQHAFRNHINEFCNTRKQFMIQGGISSIESHDASASLVFLMTWHGRFVGGREFETFLMTALEIIMIENQSKNGASHAEWSREGSGRQAGGRLEQPPAYLPKTETKSLVRRLGKLRRPQFNGCCFVVGNTDRLFREFRRR